MAGALLAQNLQPAQQNGSLLGSKDKSMVMYIYPDDRALSTSLGHPSKRLMSHMQCFENNDLFIATYFCADESEDREKRSFRQKQDPDPRTKKRVMFCKLED